MITGGIILGVAVLVTIATSLVKNNNWSSQVKNTLAVVLSVIGGAVVVVSQHNWDLASFASSDIVGTATLVYGSAQLVYHFILNGVPGIDRFVNQPLEDALHNGPKPVHADIPAPQNEGAAA